MTSSADLDTLIAALLPHVHQHLFDAFYAHASVGPAQSRTRSLSLLDSFVALLAHHPGCDTVAATAQTHQPGQTTLYICPSPSIPGGFHDNVKEWLSLFSAMGKDYTEGVPRDPEDAFSESEKRFILSIHRLCYPTMRHRAMSQGLGAWDRLIEGHEPKKWGRERMEEERLREELADELRHLSELAQTFAHSITREDLGDDEDVLRFYALCIKIRNVMKSTALGGFLNEYVYPYIGIDKVLERLRLPLAVSTLIAHSKAPKRYFDDQCSIVVLDPSLGGRPFSATMTEAHFAARFGESQPDIWEDVMCEFDELQVVKGEDTGTPECCGELEWNGQERLLSSPPGRSIIVRPEVTLIQHLVDYGDSAGEMKGYVACSEVPCYASVRYAGAVNAAVGAGFTVRADDPDWCRLDSVPPWVLPEDTRNEVVDALKEQLLLDLEAVVQESHSL